jgi:transposase
VKKFIRIGVDLAKNYFQVRALEKDGDPAVTRKLTRRKMRAFFSQIEPSYGQKIETAGKTASYPILV